MRVQLILSKNLLKRFQRKGITDMKIDVTEELPVAQPDKDSNKTVLIATETSTSTETGPDPDGIIIIGEEDK